MTPEDFQRLYQLQSVELGISQRLNTIARVDDGTDSAAELAADEAKLAELEEKLRQKQSHQRKLELDLEGVEAEKREKSNRAYGGTVSDPKELAALDRKIAELERNVHRHEDMILELLDEIEQLEHQVQAQREKTEAQRAKHAAIVDNYRQTTARAREEIEELRARREQLVSELPPKLLTTYESIRDHEGGVAVSALIGGTCSECKVAIPRVRLPMVQRGTEIVKCENCRRILVIPAKE